MMSHWEGERLFIARVPTTRVATLYSRIGEVVAPLALTIAAVISLEAVNTALEALCDVVSPEHHPAVEIAKDVAAGAVLVAAIAALVIAALIFGPYF